MPIHTAPISTGPDSPGLAAWRGAVSSHGHFWKKSCAYGPGGVSAMLLQLVTPPGPRAVD